MNCFSLAQNGGNDDDDDGDSDDSSIDELGRKKDSSGQKNFQNMTVSELLEKAKHNNDLKVY